MNARLSQLGVLFVLLVFGLGACQEDDFDLDDMPNSIFGDGSGDVFQAEDRTNQSGCSERTNHAGYTGKSFMDYGGNGTWIEWNDVNVAAAGDYTLTFRYANARSSGRRAAAIVNGQNKGNLAFSGTGSWTTWKTNTITVALRKGENTIRLQANTGSGGPNLDAMEVTADDLCPADPKKTDPGACGCGVPEGTCSGGSGNGLTGTYFNNMDFTSQVLQRIDPTIDFNWGGGSPDGKMDGNTFSVRWTGFLEVERSDNYTFYTLSDDGVRLWVDDELLIDNWTIHPPTENQKTVFLTVWERHEIKLEYYENGGGAVAKLLWSRASQAKQIIPQSSLFTDAAGETLCVEVPERKSATLTCPAGETVDSIDFASYGTPTGTCDNGFNLSTCHATSSLAKLEDACLDQQTCTVAASNGVFGDPCRGTFKKLAVVYACSGGGSDNCPNDPNKTSPGICGCGTADTDSDGDGTANCKDNCANDPQKTEPGQCGCGKADTDGDGDGTANCKDNCPSDPQKTQPGQCGCGRAEGTCGGGGSFTIGVLPDVQKVTRNDENAEWLYKIGDFFSENKDEYNLMAVASVGDLVQVATLPGTRNQTRWDRVLRFAHDLSEDDIHFIPACGNHDGCQDHYGSPLDYSAQFSDLSRSGGPDGNPARYVLKRDNPFFEGSYSTVNATHGVENAYYRIEVEGRPFIVLSLRFGDSSENGDLRKVWNNWASDVLEDNADASAIIFTHWLTDSPAWVDNPELCDHQNVMLAVVGHSHGTRFRKVLDCGGGHKVEWYQFSLPHGSNDLNEAAARLYTFDLESEEVCFKTRHIYEDRWLTEKSGCDPACSVGSCHCDEFCFDLPRPL